MPKILCCVRNFDLVERWKNTIPEHHFELVFNVDNLLTMESAIVLLDGASPEVIQFAATAKWPQLLARHRVIFGDPTPENDRGLAVLQTGCVGYCHLYTFSEQVKEIIAVISAGQLWVGRDLMMRMLTAIKPRLPEKATPNPVLSLLTEREQEVAQCVVGGLANKEIASKMQISVRTVKAHLTSIFAKLDVRDRLQLVAKMRL